jgi:hypothetical protein
MPIEPTQDQKRKDQNPGQSGAQNMNPGQKQKQDSNKKPETEEQPGG